MSPPLCSDSLHDVHELREFLPRTPFLTHASTSRYPPPLLGLRTPTYIFRPKDPAPHRDTFDMDLRKMFLLMLAMIPLAIVTLAISGLFFPQVTPTDRVPQTSLLSDVARVIFRMDTDFINVSRLQILEYHRLLETFQKTYPSKYFRVSSNILLDKAMPSKQLDDIEAYVFDALHFNPPSAVWDCDGSRFHEGYAAALSVQQEIDLEQGATILRDGISCIHEYTDNMRQTAQYLVHLRSATQLSNRPLSVTNIRWLTPYNRGTPDPRIGDFIRDLDKLRAHEPC